MRDDILNPIPGDNPSGRSLRLDPLYDKISEARREDDSLAQGAWQRERKVADHGLAIRLIEQALASESKDLQLAAWLCDSLLKREGIAGLRNGIALCQVLVERFWETLYPEIEDGELEDRSAPLEWVASKLLIPIKSVPLCSAGYNFLDYNDSRSIEYEELAKSKDQKTAREKALKDGKLAPELFDKSFSETPKVFYAELEGQLDCALEALRLLNETCAEKFGPQAAPSFTKLQDALREVRHVVHQFLQKKRETDPDPVEVPPPRGGARPPQPKQKALSRTVNVPVTAVELDALTFRNRRSKRGDQRHCSGGGSASQSRALQPGALSDAARLALGRTSRLRSGVLEAPPTEIRRQIKRWR